MYQNIVIPIKPDHLSIKTFRHAFGLAAETGGKICVLHASSKILDDDQEVMLRVSLDKFHEEENRVIQEIGNAVRALLESDELAEFKDKVPCEIQVIPDRDNAQKTIVTFANEQAADLIILSLRGRSPALALLLGNFKEWVIHYADCPVLVVHEH